MFYAIHGSVLILLIFNIINCLPVLWSANDGKVVSNEMAINVTLVKSWNVRISCMIVLIKF